MSANNFTMTLHDSSISVAPLNSYGSGSYLASDVTVLLDIVDRC